MTIALFADVLSKCGVDTSRVTEAPWGSCPVVIGKSKSKLISTQSMGEPRLLQAPDADVSLSIPHGSTGVYTLQVHTDLSKPFPLVTEDECLVAPVVEVHARSASNKVCKLSIPHCILEPASWKNVKVRRQNQKTLKVHKLINLNKKALKQKKWFCGATPEPGQHGTFEVDENCIKIYTKRFSTHTATCVNKAENKAAILMFIFAKLNPFVDEAITTTDIKVFLCCNLYSIKDFKNVRFSILLSLEG